MRYWPTCWSVCFRTTVQFSAIKACRRRRVQSDSRVNRLWAFKETLPQRILRQGLGLTTLDEAINNLHFCFLDIKILLQAFWQAWSSALSQQYKPTFSEYKWLNQLGLGQALLRQKNLVVYENPLPLWVMAITAVSRAYQILSPLLCSAANKWKAKGGLGIHYQIHHCPQSSDLQHHSYSYINERSSSTQEGLICKVVYVPGKGIADQTGIILC